MIQRRPIRVLYLDHVPRMSGAEQSLYELVTGLSVGPVEPIVVLPTDGPLATKLRADGVLVRMVPMNRKMLETSRGTLRSRPLVLFTRVLAFLGASWRIYKIVREMRPQVIHSNTMKTHLLAVLPAMAARVPLVWHVRDILPKGWLRRAFVLCARVPALIVVPSRSVANGLGKRRKSIYKKLRLIPNGVRVDELMEGSPAGKALRDEIGATNGSPVVGIVGRISLWKGQEVFVRAAAMLADAHPKAKFAVIGAVLFPENDMPFQLKLQDLVAEAGLSDRIVFLGWRSTVEAMSALDILVHASVEPEPFGRTIIEGMAAGIPVVASASGAIRELLPPTAGILIPPGRPEFLADALDTLLSDKHMRQDMGEAGMQIASSTFDVRRTVAGVAGMYQELAKKKKWRPIREPRVRMPRRRIDARPRVAVAGIGAMESGPLVDRDGESRAGSNRERRRASGVKPLQGTVRTDAARDAEIAAITAREDALLTRNGDASRGKKKQSSRTNGTNGNGTNGNGTNGNGYSDSHDEPILEVPPVRRTIAEPAAATSKRLVARIRAPRGPASLPHRVRTANPRVESLYASSTASTHAEAQPSSYEQPAVPLAKPAVARAIPAVKEKTQPTGKRLTLPETSTEGPEPSRLTREAPVPMARAQSTVPMRVLPDERTTLDAPGPIAFHPKSLYDLIKRVIDVALSAAVLVVGSPIWLLVAVLIKLDSRGPVFFRNTVIGKDAVPFTYFKFRSMRVESGDDEHREFIQKYVRENDGHEHNGKKVFKFVGDARVTSVGRWIRKFSIDEVPQLINVLKGQMSLVGPRPPLVYEYELYDGYAKQRLLVRPGLTGLQQVEARHTASFQDKIAMDLDYVSRRSTFLDLVVLVKTIPAALRGE